jgi:hypothetical protein
MADRNYSLSIEPRDQNTREGVELKLIPGNGRLAEMKAQTERDIALGIWRCGRWEVRREACIFSARTAISFFLLGFCFVMLLRDPTCEMVGFLSGIIGAVVGYWLGKV